MPTPPELAAGVPHRGGDVLQDAPAAGEQGEPAFAQAARGTLKRVAGASVEVRFPAAGWLFDRDEDAGPGAVVPGVGQGGQASRGRPVQGGQGMGAGRPGVLPATAGPLAAPGRRCRPPSPFPGLALAGLFWLAFGWTLALAWGKL